MPSNDIQKEAEEIQRKVNEIYENALWEAFARADELVHKTYPNATDGTDAGKLLLVIRHAQAHQVLSQMLGGHEGIMVRRTNANYQDVARLRNRILQQSYVHAIRAIDGANKEPARG